MHPRRSLLSPVLVLLVGLCRCGGSLVTDVEDDEGHSAPIVGGSLADEYPEAVLVDMEVAGEVAAACSGALIAPRVVLTAGHCVHGFDGWQVTAPVVMAHRRASTAVVYDWDVEGDEVDPGRHDLGLIFLKKSVSLERYPKLADQQLGPGQRVRNIGRVQDGELTERTYVGAPVAVEDGGPYGYPFAYVAEPRIQHGDSGGPAIVAAGATHTIAAVNSGGGDIEVLARVDLLRPWIEAQIADPRSACSHDACTQGIALASSCSDCAAAVCGADGYCCATKWDAQCAEEAGQACGCN